MITILQERRPHLQEQLVQKIAYFDYNFSRYHIHYTIAIAYISEEEGNLNVLSKNLRKSDRLVMFQKNLCAVIFNSADETNGLKAANNLLTDVQALFFSKHLYMAVVTATNTKSSFQLVYDLFDLLQYAIGHNMNNLVLEASQITKYD
ncbi:MAG: hypothetical protein M0P91_01240 [Sulfuricurvum sp.]|jgi:hypothetical protein|uniref:hypothetical protein n=1 Tax=Sulfuricurvum sp. TaxID=2025608 RepID=UPI0025F4C6E5|nr:hypothetical protein [Sulfuricurvum sp.]MCK9371793.1 hypothetical protein [Sulfuricurvum sp.]